MRVLMLGWEYPPHISGGLGTACEGLTRALSKYGTDLIFVVPNLHGGEDAAHMSLVDARGNLSLSSPGGIALKNGKRKISHKNVATSVVAKRLKKISIASYLTPYLKPENSTAISFPGKPGLAFTAIFDLASESEHMQALLDDFAFEGSSERYGSKMFNEVARYTALLIASLSTEKFDVIHAHDWMTYPAAVALAQLTGKPLIAHVHSLEYDRAGAGAHPTITQIEHYGLHAADCVVAVSYYTKNLITKHHAVAASKIQVVHNGVYPRKLVARYRSQNRADRRIVLFLGRVTFQKGPDYFVEAAAKVVPHVPDVLFVMAGAGDMLPRMIERVSQLGLQQHFHFPGFLKGEEVEEMYSSADVYVMPSVSEPFGISALEAISFDTPVIISRQSGVAEVLGHALKVDFWDVNRLADLIINALLHEALRKDMVTMAKEELKRLRWEAAAQKTIQLYKKLIQVQ